MVKTGKQDEFKLANINMQETKKSIEIKIICEVEKIWIVYDVDHSGELDFKEVADYLNGKTFPKTLTLEQLEQVFKIIDADDSGSINK